MVSDPVQISIVITAGEEVPRSRPAVDRLRDWLVKTTLTWEIVVVISRSAAEAARTRDGEAYGELRVVVAGSGGKGTRIREGLMEAAGEVIAVIGEPGPIEPVILGRAIALVQSDASDLAMVDLAGGSGTNPMSLAQRATFSLARMFLVSDQPVRGSGPMVFSRDAGRSLLSQCRLEGAGIDLEILYLARKYGYRIDRFETAPGGETRDDEGPSLRDIMRIRLHERRMDYRIPRRCPVCMSAETGTALQIDDQIVRKCRRCKCRYLAELFPEPDAEADEQASADEESDSPRSATRMMARRRLKIVRRFVPYGSRLLELGCGVGSFGREAVAEFEYSGIDRSTAAVRKARAAGLDVVVGDLTGFVSASGPYDCLVAFHCLETLPDPHLAFEKLRRLLKPGGILILSTSDTESVVAEISGDAWTRGRFPHNVVLYSRSALLELLESEGFDVLSAAADFEIRSASDVAPPLRPFFMFLEGVLKRPVAVPSGSVRVVARRRAGSPLVEGYESRVAERAL